MLEKIIIAIVAGLFCSMATALISIIIAPRIFKSLVLEELNHHNTEYHKETITMAIATHTKSCVANSQISQIRDAVLWLVIKAGGNPKELGLTGD